MLLTLIWVWRGVTLPSPFCFSLNKSEVVKAVILVFCSIHWLFIGDIHGKFWIPNLSQSPDTGPNSDESIYDFRISGQSLINENCGNSRTSNDVGMKLGPVTKLDKRNTATSKKLMMTSCQQMSLSNFWFMTNLEQSGSWIPDAWSVKLIFSLIITFYLTKIENRSEQSLTQLSYYCFQ